MAQLLNLGTQVRSHFDSRLLLCRIFIWIQCHDKGIWSSRSLYSQFSLLVRAKDIRREEKLSSVNFEKRGGVYSCAERERALHRSFPLEY